MLRGRAAARNHRSSKGVEHETSADRRQLEDESGSRGRAWRWPAKWSAGPRSSARSTLASARRLSIWTPSPAELAGSSVALGAQDMYDQANGAFTGEISAAMLLDVGCRYVILGHSERRQLLGETDEAVNRKTKAALAAGLIPIVCVGELLAERESGKTAAVIARQFAGSLAGLSAEQMEQVVIAYEPVWAIGTGKVATPAQAQEVHSDLRKLIAKHYNAAVAERVRIQYGGSVKPSNAAELLSQPDIDGALVGGSQPEGCRLSGNRGGGGRALIGSTADARRAIAWAVARCDRDSARQSNGHVAGPTDCRRNRSRRFSQ